MFDYHFAAKYTASTSYMVKIAADDIKLTVFLLK